jgi:regulator of replication initiation timing
MSEFNGDKKHFTAAEVENYIKKTVYSCESKLSEQKDRIFSLLEENKKLAAELEKYREKDAQISKALVHAIGRAKEIEDAAVQKYNAEIERLKNFHSKWVSYYGQIKNKLPHNADIISAEEFLRKMDAVLNMNSPQLSLKDESDAAAQYISESKRLNKKAENAQGGKADDIAATVPPEYDSGLDMNEVLNPKNLPELDEIIKQMGILET